MLASIIILVSFLFWACVAAALMIALLLLSSFIWGCVKGVLCLMFKDGETKK